MLYKVLVSFHKDYIEVRGDEIEIGIMSRPQKGEANGEIIRKIAKHFCVPRSDVRLVSGQKSRTKIVNVASPQDQNKI